MRLSLKTSLVIVLLGLVPYVVSGQAQYFSIESDIGLQKNFRKAQQYWAVGNTTRFIFHFNERDGFYTGISFFSAGRFKNRLTATALLPSTSPQQIQYTNSARVGLKEFSLGYHRYFRGGPDTETGWNLYGTGGFGVEFGRVTNTHSVTIDGNQYYKPVQDGASKFKRLTIDFGIGWELPLASDFYFYNEARVWVPTTDYPSKYLLTNTDAPFVAMICAGMRITF